MSVDSLVLTVLAVLCGLLAGFARNGRLANMVGIELRARSLLVIGIIVPLMADEFGREIAVPLVVASLVSLLTFAVLNTRIVGMSILAIGIGCNLIPTIVNDGLPVRPDALVDAGLVERNNIDDVSVVGARRIEEPDHQFRFLGDIIPLASTRQVLSFGDLIILVGLADVVANITLRRRDQRSDEDDQFDRDESDDHDLSWLFGDRSLPLVQLLSGQWMPELAVGYRNPRPAPRMHQTPRVDLNTLVVDLEPDDEPLVTVLSPKPVTVEPNEARRPSPGQRPSSSEPDFALPEVAFGLDVDAGQDPDTPSLRAFDWGTDGADDFFDDWDVDDWDVKELSDDETSHVRPGNPVVHQPVEVVEKIEPTRPRLPRQVTNTVVTDPTVIELTDVEPAVVEPRFAVASLLDEPIEEASATEQEIDDFLSELFTDLGSSKRNRRRGQRRIPDFEPVHVDGDLSLTSR